MIKVSQDVWQWCEECWATTIWYFPFTYTAKVLLVVFLVAYNASFLIIIYQFRCHFVSLATILEHIRSDQRWDEMIQSHFPCYPFLSYSFLTCRFNVNLQCGSHSGADIALHFNPRYESPGYVVHNTCQNRSWGSEERKYESPFPQGQTFTLQFLVEQDKFKVQDHSLSDLQLL